MLTNHSVDWHLVEGVYDEWRKFLSDLEDIWKKNDGHTKYDFNPITQDGFFPMKKAESAKGQTVKDMKHYFHLYFPNGRYPEEVTDKARKLFSQMHDLGTVLLEWIWENMDNLELKEKIKHALLKRSENKMQNFKDTVSFERTLLRILHYPSYAAGEEEPGAVRAAAHEDINLITILPAADSRGLQVLLNKDGTGAGAKEDKIWYEVPCEDRAIIVNIGDMLQEMTEYEYIATTHRVVKPDNLDESPIMKKDRMSSPCFIHPKAEAYLSEKYPEADIFLTERLLELGVFSKEQCIKEKSKSIVEGLVKTGALSQSDVDAVAIGA